MKKISSMALIVAAGTALSLFTPLSSAAADYYLPGDATGDGVIRINDAASINSFLAGNKHVYSVAELRRYDANSDYSVDQKDSSYLKNLLANQKEKTVKKKRFDDEAFIQADINGDGTVRTNDVSLLSKIVAQSSRPEDIRASQRYDVNEDGKTDNNDVALAKKILAGSVQAKYIKYYSKTFVQGDIDGDGAVSKADLSSLKNFLNNARIVKSGRQQQRLDVNIDGVYDIADANYLQSILDGKKTSKTVTYSEAYGLPEFEDLIFEAYSGKTRTFTRNFRINPGTLADKEAYWYPSTTSRKEDKESKAAQKDAKTTDYGTYKWNGGTLYAIDSHTFLTAGHCVTNRSRDSKNNLSLGPSTVYYPDKKTGENVVLHVNYFLLPKKFTDPTSKDTWMYDIAILTIEEDLTKAVHLDKSDFFDVAMVSNNIQSFNPKITIKGYPGYKEQADCNVKITNVFDYTIDTNTNKIGGTSGGPVFIKQADNRKVAIGIVKATNFETRISPTMYSFIKNIPAEYR